MEDNSDASHGLNMFHSSIIQIPHLLNRCWCFLSAQNSLFSGQLLGLKRWTLWFLHWLMWLVITVYAADTSGSCFCMLTCHEHKLLSWRFISSAAHTDLVYLKLQPQGLSVYQLLLPSPQLLQLFSACSYDTSFLVICFICYNDTNTDLLGVPLNKHARLK